MVKLVRRLAPPRSESRLTKLHIRKHLRNMRVVMPVPIPGPTGAGLQLSSRTVELLEPRTVDAPHIPVARRQRAPTGKPAQSLPRQRQFNGPARRLHMHRMPQPRKVPIQKTPAFVCLSPWYLVRMTPLRSSAVTRILTTNFGAAIGGSILLLAIARGTAVLLSQIG